MATEREIEEIKTRLNIYDIASTYISLKRSGANYFGLCPFHNEHSPSFSVNPDLGLFKCFGCQESGDIITFVQKIENLTFGEAIAKLAQMAGVTLTESYKEEKSEKKQILEVNALTNNIFHYLLTKHQAGKTGAEYFTKRHISAASIEEFSLGYDHGNTVINLLQKRRYTSETILKYGLGVTRQGRLVDKYRSRVIFPIFTMTGEVAGFAGRIIDDQANSPKYINSPETDAFRKSSILFGLYNTKKYIKEANNAILLEGPVDVISAFQNGVKNVCAVQGTSLTTSHLQLLKRLTENISFCFDQDKAGIAALKRGFTIAQEAGMQVKVIHIHDAKDVDERVNKDKEAWMKEMQTPVDAIEFLISHETAEQNISSLEGKLKVIRDIIPFIASVKEEIKRSFYVRKLSEAVLVEESELRVMLTGKDEKTQNILAERITRNNPEKDKRLSYLLALLVQYFDSVKEELLAIDTDYIPEEAKAFISSLQEIAKQEKQSKDIQTLLQADIKNMYTDAMTKKLTITDKENEIVFVKAEISSMQVLFRKQIMKAKIALLRRQLRMYETEQNEDQAMQTSQKMADLLQISI